MKIAIRDIGDGLHLNIDKTRVEVDAMMEITKGEFRGTDEGLRANLRLQKLDDGTILVRGGARVGLGFACVRCLEPRERVLEAEVDAVLFPESTAKFDDEHELTAEEMDVSFYDDSNDELDLTDTVREALLLEMPSYPTCSEQEVCKPHQLDVEEEDGPAIDPRWQALVKIKERMTHDDTN
ncbi:MAG: DUF177 domain-containing protein [Myxococcota bacterium]